MASVDFKVVDECDEGFGKFSMAKRHSMSRLGFGASYLLKCAVDK